eukprot:316549_1
MADTIRSEEEEKEYFDDEKELDRKITLLADLIRKSKHFTCFTGAGISTSTGIADYRSGLNTVLNTGPGLWVKEAAEEKGINIEQYTKTKKEINIMMAYPSITHFALNELQKRNHLKFLTSQNVDGLHFKSGFPLNKLVEIHGNYNIEYCPHCDIQYWRTYKTRISGSKTHLTARKCTKCTQPLYDSIIDFDDALDSTKLSRAMNEHKLSDLCLVLGSSLSVYPACRLPDKCLEPTKDKKKGTLVIVNLQKTDSDKFCSLRIFAKCDDVMKILMNKLNYELLLQFVYDGYIVIDVKYVDVDAVEENVENIGSDDELSDERKVKLYCFNAEGMKSSFINKICVQHNNDKTIIIEGDNMKDCTEFEFITNYWDSTKDSLNVTFGFIDYYNEPDLIIPFHEYLIYGQPGNGVIKMQYNANTKQWMLPKLKTVQNDPICLKLLTKL